MNEHTIKEISKGLAEIQTDVIKKVVKLADKHGIDRDELYEQFLYVGCLTSKYGTLKNFKVGGNENE